MSDLMKKENRSKIALGATGVAGGVALITLTSYVAGHFLPALIVGGLVVWGGWKLFQKPNSALVGMIGLAAGVVVAAAGIPIVGGLASLLLGISGIGLIGGGIWAIYQTFRSRRF